MLQKIRKQITYARFAVREWWPLWFYVLNRRGRRAYAEHPVILSALQSKVVGELQTDGISFSSLDELFPGEDWYARLRNFLDSKEAALSRTSKKDYIVNYWELIPPLDFSNPFLQFAIESSIVSISHAYMKMWTRLNYYHAAKTLPVGDTTARFSQNWHRDPEEKRMLKIFIYLNDVDVDGGPFTYVKKSTYGLQYGHTAPQKPPEGSYPSPDLVEKTIPKEEIIIATGKAGTVIFCDTSGIHKGGHAKSKERIMSTTYYTADTWTAEPPRYRHTPDTRASLKKYNTAVQYLLEIDTL